MTFHDASSACKKTYQTRDDFFFKPSEFPQINTSHKPNNENVITPNQRRTVHFNNNSKKRTFSQTVINEPTRKRVIHQSGYDKKAHNDNLNFPNGRTQNANSSTSISNSMPYTSRNSYNTDSEYSLSYHNISQSPSSAAKNNYDTTNLPKYTAPEEDTIQLIEKFLHLPSAKEALHGFILSYMNRETYQDLDDPVKMTKKNNIKILQWNIRSVNKNRANLAKFSEGFDIIFLNETWLKTNHNFYFKPFCTIRQDREDGYGGDRKSVV